MAASGADGDLTHATLLVAISAPDLKSKKVVGLGRRPYLPAVFDFIHSVITRNKERYEAEARAGADPRDAFYVLDLGRVAALWDQWTAHLPAVRPFYAVKCNPDPSLLAALAALGAGFDCASRAEIDSVLSLVDPVRIVFANPCKPESHLRSAAAAGIHLTTFDSVHELTKLRRCHPTASALLRLRPPTDSAARCPLGAKYGALPDEVTPLLTAAAAAVFRVVGAAFHIGSGDADHRAYRPAVAAARDVFNAAANLGLPPMTVLNVGGGFTAGDKFPPAGAALRSALDEYFSGESGLTIIAEPGRFFAESAFTLATNIMGKRVRSGLTEYWINDGIYGSMNCLLYDHATIKAIPLASGSRPDNPKCEGVSIQVSTVFGPTCDGLDTVLTDFRLPDLDTNDWLVFPNMGAYTAAAGSRFNGFDSSDNRTYLAYSVPP